MPRDVQCNSYEMLGTVAEIKWNVRVVGVCGGECEAGDDLREWKAPYVVTGVSKLFSLWKLNRARLYVPLVGLLNAHASRDVTVGRLVNSNRRFEGTSSVNPRRLEFFNCLTLKMKALRSFEMSVTVYYSTQRKIIPQDEFSKLYAKYEGGEKWWPTRLFSYCGLLISFYKRFIRPSMSAAQTTYSYVLGTEWYTCHVPVRFVGPSVH